MTHGPECPLTRPDGVTGAIECQCIACYCGADYERGWMGSCARCYRPLVRDGRVQR